MAGAHQRDQMASGAAIQALTSLDNTGLAESLVAAIERRPQPVVAFAEFISSLLFCVAADEAGVLLTLAEAVMA